MCNYIIYVLKFKVYKFEQLCINKNKIIKSNKKNDQFFNAKNYSESLNFQYILLDIKNIYLVLF